MKSLIEATLFVEAPLCRSLFSSPLVVASPIEAFFNKYIMGDQCKKCTNFGSQILLAPGTSMRNFKLTYSNYKSTASAGVFGKFSDSHKYWRSQI
jgi:hypothetical protein